MIRPISLRIRHTQAIDQAEATLIRAGRGEEVRRAQYERTMRTARHIVERAQEQARLKRYAKLAAEKAILATRQAYDAQIKVADEFDRERWLGLKDFVLSELRRISEGQRP